MREKAKNLSAGARQVTGHLFAAEEAHTARERPGGAVALDAPHRLPKVDKVVYVAAGLSLVAALTHLWEAPEHLDEWWGYGAFLVISALAQGLFGVMLIRWPASQLIPLAGICGNLSIVVMYVISRTWGMPLGPGAAHIEEPEMLGTVSTVAELGIIFISVALLRNPYRNVTMNVLLLAGITIWVLRLAGVLP